MHTIREKIYSHYIKDINERSISKRSEDFEKFIQNIPQYMAKVNVNLIRESEGYQVKTYKELVRCVAELGYLNPQFNLLYRGQDKDYKGDTGSIIYPSIFRPEYRKTLTTTEIQERFKSLEKIHMKLLSEKRKIFLEKILLSYPEYYYALIQHYEKSLTPLIDLTQSLRVAATFAIRKDISGYVLVFGMPHPHGSISHFIDQEMVLVKLQNVCPPNSLRPHYQEGYLAGNFPFKEVRQSGDNLARRLIGKYYLDNSDNHFWDKGFSRIPEEALFPKNDPFQKELNEILKKELSNNIFPTGKINETSGKIGESAKILDFF